LQRTVAQYCTVVHTSCNKLMQAVEVNCRCTFLPTCSHPECTTVAI